MDALRAQAVQRRTFRQAGWKRMVLPTITGLIPVCALSLTFHIVGLSSASMSPTLLPGDSVLVNRLIYHLFPPRRGDLIVVRFPQTGGREFVKRIIGLPGDVVEERGGRMSVNGMAVRWGRDGASSGTRATRTDLDPSRVPANRLYVLGDNWGTSLDSRSWGTVDEQEVVGKPFLICWSRETEWWEVRWDRMGRWVE
jgi:signal peptidase I